MTLTSDLVLRISVSPIFFVVGIPNLCVDTFWDGGDAECRIPFSGNCDLYLDL